MPHYIKMNSILKLIRIKQWYKNIVIFIPLIFALNLFDKNLFIITCLGFFSLSFISSCSYIINDLIDVEKDKYHPEKKNRPIATGEISKQTAILVLSLLFIVSLIIAFSLSLFFFYAVISLFSLSQVYNFYLRDIAFLDIIVISINFAIRAISGIFLISVPFSYWIILCTFFLSVFLVSGKRISEINLKELKHYRSCFSKKNKEALNLMVIVSLSAIIVFFSIYSIFYDRHTLLISLPFSFYAMILYFHSIYNSPKKIRNPEEFILDKKIIFIIILWLISIIFPLYIL